MARLGDERPDSFHYAKSLAETVEVAPGAVAQGGKQVDLLL